MVDQVLVKPAHITNVTPKVTPKPQPPWGSYTFSCSAQTSPQLSLLCAGEEIDNGSQLVFWVISYQISSKILHTVNTGKFCSVCLVSPHRAIFLRKIFLRHKQNVITERLFLVISAGGCPIKQHWEQILQSVGTKEFHSRRLQVQPSKAMLKKEPLWSQL